MGCRGASPAFLDDDAGGYLGPDRKGAERKLLELAHYLDFGQGLGLRFEALKLTEDS